MNSPRNFPIERLILGLVAFVMLIGNVVLSGDAAAVCNKIGLVGLVVLGFFYGWQLRDKWGALCVALALTLIKGLFDSEWSLYLYYASIGVNVLIGVLFVLKTISESKANNDWELFGTLISLSFFYPLIHHLFFLSENAFVMVYHFAVAFLIAYVMYYENLWDKYNKGEKRLLMLVISIHVYEVLVISLKNLF